MSGYVWVSTARADGDLIGYFYTDTLVKDFDLAVQGQVLNEKGQPVPETMCPKRIWGGRSRFVFLSAGR